MEQYTLLVLGGEAMVARFMPYWKNVECSPPFFQYLGLPRGFFTLLHGFNYGA